MRKYTFKHRLGFIMFFVLLLFNGAGLFFYFSEPVRGDFFDRYMLFFIINGIFLLMFGIIGMIMYFKRDMYGYTAYVEGSTLVVEKKSKKKRFDLKSVPKFGYMYLGYNNYRFFFKSNQGSYEFMCNDAHLLCKEILDRVDQEFDTKKQGTTLTYMEKVTFVKKGAGGGI